jgi:hypothetical protein
MRVRNKSAIYGYYGGVTEENHYNPLSASDTTYAWNLTQELKNFILQNASNMVLRQNTNSQPGNIDTFVLSTSGKPEDIITYTSSQDVVMLDDIAGVGIASDTEEPIDGGTF